MHAPRTPRRRGFTLVELLVVVGLTLVLSALAVGVAYSGILDSHKLTSGTDKLSGWLLQARAKAGRDLAPRGLRLVVGPNNFVTECVPIEEPEPYVPNPANDPFGYRVAFVNLRQQNGTMQTEVHLIWGDPLNQAVQAQMTANLTALRQEITPGEVLRLTEFGTLHQITSISNAPVTTLEYLPNPHLPEGPGNARFTVPSLLVQVTNTTLLPGLAALYTQVPAGPPNPPRTPNLTTGLFGVRRLPRPTLGEQPLQITAGVGIDFANSLCPQNNATTSFDILFAPSGEVLGAQSFGRIVLWVRNPGYNGGANPRTGQDPRTAYEQAGEMALVTIYTRTGAVATHPVNVPLNPGANPGHDPYAYTKDGINSGL